MKRLTAVLLSAFILLGVAAAQNKKQTKRYRSGDFILNVRVLETRTQVTQGTKFYSLTVNNVAAPEIRITLICDAAVSGCFQPPVGKVLPVNLGFNNPSYPGRLTWGLELHYGDGMVATAVYVLSMTSNSKTGEGHNYLNDPPTNSYRLTHDPTRYWNWNEQ